jgi:glycine cleavage system H protein
MTVPNDRKYTEHDEWALLEDGVVTLGITDFAQDALGELVHIELPEVGDTLDAGEAACEVESVKAVAEVFSPVGGEVVAVNETLDGEEETVNEDPYGAGWLVKIRVTDGDLDNCLSADAYSSKLSQS